MELSNRKLIINRAKFLMDKCEYDAYTAMCIAYQEVEKSKEGEEDNE